MHRKEDKADRMNSIKVIGEVPTFVGEASPRVRSDFERAVNHFQLPQGQQVLHPGQVCGGMAFPVVGSLRIYLVGADGREITLYRVRPDEGCILSAACIMGGQGFPAMAQVEEAVSGWQVSASIFRRWVSEEPFWRDYVFKLLGQRLAGVLGQFESFAFGRLEVRLARCLTTRATEASPTVQMTQQALANELGSAREVVSRILNRWQSSGWVTLARAA